MLAYDRSSTGLWVALIFLVSLNLRPAIAAVGPVLAQMGTDLAWGEGVQGVLTAIPLIAFAVVSPLVTFLARRIGIDISILLALLCIAAGDFARSFGGGVGIWLGTVVFASAIAVGNVLVPVIAKRDYAGHVAMATGVIAGRPAPPPVASPPAAPQPDCCPRRSRRCGADGARRSPSGACRRWSSPCCGRCVSCTIARSSSRRPPYGTRLPPNPHVPNRREACSPVR